MPIKYSIAKIRQYASVLHNAFNISNFKRWPGYQNVRQVNGISVFWPYLLMSMTIVVIMAARNTKPPKTPKAMIPPSNKLRKSENM